MKNLWCSLRIYLFLTLLLGLLYPLGFTGLAKVLFPVQATGSQVDGEDKVQGSKWIGQKFEQGRYFWGRPSSVDYNPLPSGGSNWGLDSTDLKKLVVEREAKMKAAHGAAAVPQELLFASASGLDPDISPATADYQIERVARARGLSKERVLELVKQFTEGPSLGILGEATVNVLRLNLALDHEVTGQM